ncbi:Gfo/Idh/MocA family protein [Paenibacillus piri]|uniref:Gfo/Idh/MocA family oxidoreductase n=1 Tax=Paenibacillus piri TaxID=2547395 RepID=A0A4R5KJQ1_9BACL|nr:Gfo/Idh/MocA family oxidoreductase [Paenibacillus piri]TDF95769.1 Gfo/Idh/MocA family oxidoreductase [Paenibacillus piri]
MSVLRMGVIGTGGISNTHIKGILRSDNLELAAISDVQEAQLQKCGEQYGVAPENRHLDYKELLSRPDIDAVSICTPNFVHYEIAKEAILHGKPFLLEKPVAMNEAEARELRDLALERKVKSMVAFSYRYKAAARYAKFLIEQGHLGKINHIYGQYLQSWGLKDAPLVWRLSKKHSGSGALGDLGSHMLDLTRFLVGEITELTCDAGVITEQRKLPGSDDFGQVDVDDYCHYMARINGHIHGAFQISRMAFSRGNYQRVEVYGSEGGLVYELEAEDTLRVSIGPVYGKALEYHRINVPKEFYADQMQSFYELVTGMGDGLSATIEDGYINQKTIDAIITSFENKTWVTL